MHGHDARFNPCATQRCEELQARMRRIHEHFHAHHHEFQQYHRFFRYARPVILLFNLTMLYLLFSWAGFKAFGIFFAVLIAIKEIFQFVFLLRLEQRIMIPIEQLRQGVDQVARGNYDINLECRIPNDLGMLIAAFNEMALQLREGERVKAEYEENRKNLVANISHDLKTPITAIQGHIEALLDQPELAADRQEKYLKVIHNNAGYLNRLIDDLFLFSKLDMQKLDFRFQPMPIRNYLRDVMEEYQIEMEGRGIGFRYADLLPDQPQVLLDGKRLYQAINNIVANAKAHGRSRELSLQVRLYRRGAWIAIDIEDNGPGIPEDKLPHIFERFYRVDAERTKDLESTGLGLAITRELLQAHGGEVSVASGEGAGACFTLLLPEYAEPVGEP
ncbi:sensor histidine kinase [Geomesophilobacter sediminis]|uniref:histidine kinase n=1 Tax=Geomesophilobacter sediminis TaxID=2798584 RepID=A0A8J7M141_9BACT|nr:HAMP domain-containing sensor histidine kinase [Geomesophilobacter sediminis]MBJ6726707.1 HAMP domain-containing histidine kinase [Geomesophilobacter sediminis]